MQNLLCNVCNNGDVETAKHFLYVSEPLTTSRLHFETTIKEVMYDGEQIVRTLNVQDILRADTAVGVSRMDTLYNLSLIAKSVHSMFLHRNYCTQGNVV